MASTNPTREEMIKEIEALKAANAKLEAERAAKVVKPTVRVSDKGAISVYGLSRFPLTVYAESFLKLLAMGDEIKAFIEANKAVLSHKGDTVEVAQAKQAMRDKLPHLAAKLAERAASAPGQTGTV